MYRTDDKTETPKEEPIFVEEYLDIEIGTEVSYGYWTEGTDTAISNACAYEVKVNQDDKVKTYRISKQMYKFLNEDNMIGYTMKCKVIDNDSLYLY